MSGGANSARRFAPSGNRNRRLCGPHLFWYMWHLVAVAHDADGVARGHNKRKKAMTTPKPRPSIVHGESHAYPVLPLRDIVVFPHMIVPLFVGREKSIRALEEVMKNDALIMLATQKNASDDDPAPDSIYETGTLASVLQLLKLPDGTVKVLVEGLERARVQKYTDRTEFYEASAIALADSDARSVEAEALSRSVVSDFES